MKRILMRAAVSPLDYVDPRRLTEENTIGGNQGNLLFPFSLFRTLMTEEETRIDTIRTDRMLLPEELDRINETYDCFVIPLANAFRQDFVGELKRMTHFVSKLKIPCVVTGVGVQAGIDADMNQTFPFDREAAEFVRNILNHSSRIGVRGEMTAAYLKHLGFREEQDFTVIGCPSMYLFGRELPKPEVRELGRESAVSTNRKPPLPDIFHRFMDESMKKLPNHFFLPQNLADVELLYAGVPLSLSKHRKFPDGYPTLPSDPLFLEDRVRAFVNVPSWLDFLKTMQFSFGSRIHGNIAAVLAGTPAFIFACDARVRELAEYHKIPHMWIQNMREDTDIFSVYESTDFYTVQKGHEQRFHHYIDFLNENGLENVYDGRNMGEILPFDKKLGSIEQYPPVHSLFTRPYQEQAEILAWYDTRLVQENRELKQRLSDRGRGTGLDLMKRMYKKIKGR